MTLLLAALTLPILFWDHGPETSKLLLNAHIKHLLVPTSMVESWRGVAGLSVEPADPAQRIKLSAPSVTFRYRQASATRAPWVNSNGWRFLRQPDGHYYYDAQGPAAALAAAEAFMYEADAVIHTDETGLAPLGKMLAFLGQAGDPNFPASVNIGFIDDGSPESGEFMNLLVRRNLLVKVVKQPDPHLLTVGVGMPGYSKAEAAANPSLLAEKVRSALTDEKRLLRIYGSEVVVGRLTGNDRVARLDLINYGAARAPIEGLRVRVCGAYHTVNAVQYDGATTNVLDIVIGGNGTEFTLPELNTFAIINLAR